jgi:uncharacterized protein
MGDVVQTIKKFVEEECKKPANKYGYDAFLFHFVPMVKYAEKLAERLGGDKEIILIASWLHDIGSILYGRENHHITGSKIAEEKLKELNYPEEKIELVKKCILNHRGSQQNKRESIEEQIVAEADVLSNFDNIAGMLEDISELIINLKSIIRTITRNFRPKCRRIQTNININIPIILQNKRIQSRNSRIINIARTH